MDFRVTTSNFKLAGHLRNAVAISAGVPRGWKGRRLPALAPPRSLLKVSRQPGGSAVYDRHFGEQLSRLDPPVLICWEAFNVRCHRRMVAEWLEQALGIEIPEFGHLRSESISYAQQSTAAAA